MSDGDSFYQKVRRETARLLGYEDTDNLPADQAPGSTSLPRCGFGSTICRRDCFGASRSMSARCSLRPPRIVTALAHARACPSPRWHFRAGAVASIVAGGDRG
jgi:hypothetical protein